MYFRREQLKRSARAPAKLNLYLEILSRRSDGFHELETLMVPISLSDSLTFTPTAAPADGSPGKIRLSLRQSFSTGPFAARGVVPPGATNLVVQALEHLRARSGCRPGADVELVKRIPAAAGLGGASSDAAAALLLANRSWELNWPSDRLAGLAGEIGSDVPFFIAAGAAICRGRGQLVQPLSGLPRLDFVLVKPEVGLKTAEVYQKHDAMGTSNGGGVHGGAAEIAAALMARRFRKAAASMHNRLQNAAAQLSPWFERIEAAFGRLDCIVHQMTGSGTAYFGLCRSRQHARRVSALLKSQQLGLVYATRSYP